MKKSPYLLPWFVSLAFAGGLLAPFPVSAAQDLIKNVDLEAVNAKGELLDWHPGPARHAKEGDNHFLRLVQKDPGKMTMLYRTFEWGEGFDRLVLSFKGRVTGLVAGEQPWFDARIILNVKDAKGKQIASDSVYFNGDTEGWQRRELTIRLPADARRLDFMPSLFQAKAGVFDFDDVRLTLLKPGEKVPSTLPQARARELPKVALKPLTAQDRLHVKGNRLVNASGAEVWLQGVAVPSLEWSEAGDHVQDSVAWAVADWKANVIRLALSSTFWFGEGKYQNPKTGAEDYRRLVDDLVKHANDRGCYMVIDLHEYKAPTARHVKFWRDCAARHANKPGVLFDILNEPHDISWREWRDGGALKDGGGKAAAENGEAKDVTTSVGMQKLVDEIRAVGAKNVIIAGGLDWSYDCEGILKGYALADPNGDGIVYSVHVYPWKSDWQKKFLDCAAKHPLFLGEVGCQPFKMPWEQVLQDPYKWGPDVLACIQKHRLNWTAWSFHTSASPCVISDWNYTPTACWGSFVRAALRGTRFVSDRQR